MKEIQRPVLLVEADEVITYGIQDTLDVLSFGFDCQNAIVNALSDGKVNLWDLPFVLKPLTSAGDAVQGFQNVKNELLDLDDSERDTVHAFVRERFDIADDEIEALIEQTIDEVLGDIEVALKWSDRRRKSKSKA